MQGIRWDDLQVFLAIARHGQLARAASAFGVNATTMGRRLRRLEGDLCCVLFEQSRHGQVLSEAGEALLSRIEAMDLIAANLAETRSLNLGLVGTLRVSVAEGFGTWFLARHLPSFSKLHPNITVDLVASGGFLSPSRREADLAIVLARPKTGPLITRKLTDYALRLYASESYLDRFGIPQTPDELASGHRLVGYIPDLIYAPELRYLDEFHDGLSANIRSSSINAQHQIISADGGIGILPCFIGNTGGNLKAILREMTVIRTFWLVHHKDTVNHSKVKAFTRWLVDLAAANRAVLLPTARAT
jgi:DNA-binding transcriptional LysR family regulator